MAEQDIDYKYVAQKLRAANHYLQLPSPRNQERITARIFSDCSLAANEIESLPGMDESILREVRRMRELMKTSWADDPSRPHMYAGTPEASSTEEQDELRRIVGDLLRWAEERSGGEDEPEDDLGMDQLLIPPDR